jgi:hypothetical protein
LINGSAHVCVAHLARGDLLSAVMVAATGGYPLEVTLPAARTALLSA